MTRSSAPFLSGHPASIALPPVSQSVTTDGYFSSGQSPGRRVHLVGPGHVGRCFLRQLAVVDPGDRPFTVVAISDSSGSVFAREGLDVPAVLAHKQRGGAIAQLPGAEAIPADVAIAVVAADVVVDATPSGAAGTAAALARGRAALRTGAFLALSGKNALAAAAAEWLLPPRRGRVGINAVLGGAGRQLVAQIEELRGQARSVALCGNVTTTVIIQAIERGASVAAGIDEARQLGLLEPDPTLDLDGSDAAVKLAAVHGAVFGEHWLQPIAPTTIAREDVRGLEPERLRERARRGATTRLIARAARGGAPRVAFEELPASSPLAAPPDRVVYAYDLPTGLRVHTGLGVGHERTAQALLADVLAAEVRS